MTEINSIDGEVKQEFLETLDYIKIEVGATRTKFVELGLRVLDPTLRGKIAALTDTLSRCLVELSWPTHRP